MPVSGLPVAVEAVLDSLMSQYHLVSWQVSGGDRGVVLTLRWSTVSSEFHHSPTRAHRAGSPRGEKGGCGGVSRQPNATCSRRTEQWVEEHGESQNQGHSNEDQDEVDHADFCIPNHSTTRIKNQDQTDFKLDGSEDSDFDPPPLPPPPPIPDNYQFIKQKDIGFHSDESQKTTDTVIENEARKPVFKQLVKKHKKGILKLGETEQKGTPCPGEPQDSTSKLYPDISQCSGKPKKDKQKKEESQKLPPKIKFRFKELIRKHSDEIKKFAAERRRKERDRQRLREQEKAKAKSKLRSRSEDNILSVSSKGEESNSDENLRAVTSEANVSSKNEHGARHVRFSETGARKNNHSKAKKVEAEDPNNPTAIFVYAGEEAGDERVQQEEQGDVVDIDEEVDSSDAEEVGSHPRRRIGALFTVGEIVAKRKRRTKLK